MPWTLAKNRLIDIVIPAQDNGRELDGVLTRINHRVFRSVVVVDRGSEDDTAQVAREHGTVLLREPRCGYGTACLRAIAHLGRLPARPEVVVFLSADGSESPESLAAVLEPVLSGNAELSMGIRQQRRSWKTRGTLGLVRIVYGHRFEDIGTQRAILFPALVALGMAERGDAWHIEMSLRAVKLGLRIAEVAIPYTPVPPRTKGLGDRASSTGRALFQILRHSTSR